MKRDIDGYVLYRNDDKGWGYYRKVFLVDGRYYGTDEIFDIANTKTLKEAEAIIRKHYKKYDYIYVWAELQEGDVDDYNVFREFNTVSSIKYRYEDGKRVSKQQAI